MKTCEECNATVTDEEIGHRADCSRCADDGSRAAAEAWIASRPAAVQAAIAKYPPTHLYRMKSTGHRVHLLSFDEAEDGTVTTRRVAVRQHLNPERLLSMDRDVFGVELADLEDLGEYRE